MKKIVEIDDKHYFGKVLPEQDLVILFKRPNCANDKECESFFNDLLDIIKDGGDNLFSSDIVSRTQWNNDVIEIIGEFLYVNSRECVIVSEGINCVCGRNYDELNDGNRRVALIQTAQPQNYYWKYASVATIILCLFLIVRCITNHLEENRFNANQELYSNDLSSIDSLRDEFQKATSDSHSYAPYISGSDKIILANKLDSLREAANSNIEKVRDSGYYSPVMGNVQTYKTAINQLVDEAKKTEQVALENARIERNKKSYEKDVQTIQSLKDALSNVTNNQSYSNYVSESQVRIIKAVLDSLNNTAEASYRTVEHSGAYNKLSIDSVGIWGQIQAIAESAQEEYERKNKPRTIVTPVTPTRKRVTTKQSTNNNNIARYNNLVNSANEDYTIYYRSGDKAAARRAYNNYCEALRIQNNSNIAKRCNILKRELGL